MLSQTFQFFVSESSFFFCLMSLFVCSQRYSVRTIPNYFFKWANPGLFFVYFCLFHMTQFKYKLIIALMVCLGLEPRAIRWKAQTNTLSYGGTHLFLILFFLIFLYWFVCSLSLFLSLFLSILLPFPLKTIFNCQLEGQSQTSTLSDQLKVSRAGLNIIKRFGPQNISRGSPGLVVKWGDSCSEGRRFESQRCILDGHFSHLFGVKIVMFVWIDENEWKRG